jgi:hypothetical protein
MNNANWRDVNKVMRWHIVVNQASSAGKYPMYIGQHVIINKV